MTNPTPTRPEPTTPPVDWSAFVLGTADLDRFNSYVMPEPNSGCWLWVGKLDTAGYGRFVIRRRGYSAHRLAYRNFKCDIPNGLHLDHLCRVRCCVNPDHLEPVTAHENALRGLTGKYQRQRTHCKRGHALSGENVATVTMRGGRVQRRCKTCRNSHHGVPNV